MDHMTDKNEPAPAGSQRLATFFTVNECAKALAFYQDTLGAELVSRFDGPDGTVMHAEMRLAGCTFQLSDPMPEYGLVGPPAEGNCFTMILWTPEPDEVFDRLVAAGATPISPVADVFSGDRMGVLRCPFGIRWCVSRHDRDVSHAEIEAAARDAMSAEQ
jgi:PhnB protein